MKIGGNSFNQLGMSFAHENIRSANISRMQKKLDQVNSDLRKKGYMLKNETVSTASNSRGNTDKAELSKSSMRIQERMTEQSRIAQDIMEREANRDRIGERIIKKAKAGKELSPKEMNYLAEKYPEVYRKVRMAQMEREMLKQQMKAVKDKVGVDVAYANAIARVRDSAEDGEEMEMRLNQLTDEYRQFKEGEDYKDKDEYNIGEQVKMALNDVKLFGDKESTTEQSNHDTESDHSVNKLDKKA